MSKALRSFFGAGKREQTVFTPVAILQVPWILWGRIAYDPCHGDPGEVAGEVSAVPVASIVNATERTSTRGLIDPWPDKTFANSPYDKLKDWLAMSLEQPTDHIMLVPVRPNRKWWRAWARRAELVYLNPVTFEGHKQTFPAPLCLARLNGGPGFTDLCEGLGIGESL